MNVPKDPALNRLYRAAALRLAERHQSVREELVRRCQDSILFWIDLFGWQFNPREKGRRRVTPFVTWDFQEAALLATPEKPYESEFCGIRWTTEKGLLWCYENDKTFIVEKSRYMGWTWLVLYFEEWLCQFHPYTQVLNISRSAEAVDDNTPDSLHWKLRFIQENMPAWLTGKITAQKMHLKYHRTEANVTGEASTGRAGVGGRASFIFADEVSKIREAAQVRQRTANTANCRGFVSTHEGPNTEFYRMTKTPEFVQIRTHWLQHPGVRKGAYRYIAAENRIEILDKKNPPPIDYPFVRSEKPTGGPHPGIRSPVYDAKCAEIGSAQAVAVEMDIDVLGSTSQVFDPIAIGNLIRSHCRPPVWEGVLDHDTESGRGGRLVRKAGGPIRMWMIPRHDGTVPFDVYGAGVDCATGSGATPSCLSLGSATTGEKVLEFVDAKIKPEPFGVMAVALCWLFQSAGGTGTKLCWECPGPGQVFGDKVLGLGYRNCHKWESEGRGPTTRSNTERYGWYNTPNGKLTLMAIYEMALLKGEIINPSKEAMEETLRFEYLTSGAVDHAEIASPNDPSGARLNHGDRTHADALMLKMLKSLGLGRVIAEAPISTDPPQNSLAWRQQYHRLREYETVED